ncbi:hypothetical protein Tco_0015391 [Tanacetum coccineum]
MPPKRTTTPINDATIKQLIAQGVADALAEYEANKSSGNGDDSHDSRSGGRRTVPTARECTYSDFLKCQPINFKGTEGVCSDVVEFPRQDCWGEIKKLEIEMWNLKFKGTDVVSYTQRFQELALIYGIMFPEESDQVEKYVGGLPDMIQGSVMASKPKTMQEAIEIANDLIDQKVRTFADHQAENKRKQDDKHKNIRPSTTAFLIGKMWLTFSTRPRQLGKHEEVTASYDDLRAAVEGFDTKADNNKNNYDIAINSVMECVEQINEERVEERNSFLKALTRVSENLEAGFALKATMQQMADTYISTSGNITNLTELLRNANLTEILTQLNAFQTSLNSLHSKCPSILESLKKDPELKQRLLKAAEGYIHNSVRLTEIANSLKEINFLSLQTRITQVENTQVTMQTDISSIKDMVNEMFQDFKGLSSSTASGSATIPTTTSPKANATVGGGF